MTIHNLYKAKFKVYLTQRGGKKSRARRKKEKAKILQRRKLRY
jgi:hypothetical protein